MQKEQSERLLAECVRLHQLLEDLTHIFQEMRIAQMRLETAKLGSREHQDALIDSKVWEAKADQYLALIKLPVDEDLLFEMPKFDY